jgi:hypothetical protein
LVFHGETLPHDHLKPPFGSGGLTFRMNVGAVQSDHQRSRRLSNRIAVACSGLKIEERAVLLTPFAFELFGRPPDLHLNRCGIEVLVNR